METLQASGDIANARSSPSGTPTLRCSGDSDQARGKSWARLTGICRGGVSIHQKPICF